MLTIVRVHEDFRLVLVAEDKDVYSRFPIPLINRLEKHFLGKLFDFPTFIMNIVNSRNGNDPPARFQQPCGKTARVGQIILRS